MFSSTAEYALRAVVCLALNPEARMNSAAISKLTRVPPGYLSKVLNDLVTAQIVTSQRGPNGGFQLSRNPAQVSVLSVINAVDPIERIRTCPLGIAAHGTTLCRLHRKLDDTLAIMEKTLDAATIAEMCEPVRAPGKVIYPTVGAPRKARA